MKYQTLLFDFDGTLSPTLDYWFQSFRVALEKLGIEATDAQILENCFYKNDGDIERFFGLQSSADFWRHTSAALRDCLSAPEMFSGVDDVLAHCESAGIPVGLVTSGERGVVEPALHRLGIHHHFDVTVTADDITHFKPHPEPVLKALNALNADPKSTLFIGDHLVDIAAGKAAGTYTAVFFTDGHSRFHRLEEIKEAKPTFIFHDYRDLLSTLQR